LDEEKVPAAEATRQEHRRILHGILACSAAPLTRSLEAAGRCCHSTGVNCVSCALGVGRPSPLFVADRHHEDRTPTHGYEPTREAAMTAFAKSWRREYAE